jgi:hypothetical protein
MTTHDDYILTLNIEEAIDPKPACSYVRLHSRPLGRPPDDLLGE